MESAQFANRMRGNAAFLANFGASKALVYLIPLTIAAVAPAAVYGGIEFAWAAGLLVASILVGAPLSGVTQRYIVGKERVVADEIALVTLLAAGAGTLIWWAMEAVAAPLEWRIAAASFAVAILHNSISTIFRMSGRRNLTAWADGTATLVAGALAAILWVVGSLTLSGMTMIYGAAGVAIAAGSALVLWRTRAAGLRDRLAASFAIGLPMLAGGVLAMWLGVGGRMMVGFFDAAHVAAYSFAFRVGGVALGVHQLAITALFARIYGAVTKRADQMLAPFLGGVAMLTAGIAVAGPLVVPYFRIEALAGDGVAVFVRILPIVCLQVFFWIAFAMLQMRVNRYRLAATVFWPMLWVTVGGTGLIVAAMWGLGLGIIGLCWGIAAQSVAYFLCEIWVLSRRKLNHARVNWVALGGGIALSVIAVGTLIIRGPLP